MSCRPVYHCHLLGGAGKLWELQQYDERSRLCKVTIFKDMSYYIGHNCSPLLIVLTAFSVVFVLVTHHKAQLSSVH